ncbi:MAG: NUDIX domain-containing protein, partial [Bacilli bacterium]
LHYNLPAGGVEAGESVIEAVIREAKEEASVDVEVGPIAFVLENAPHLSLNKSGIHGLHLMFDCTIKEGSIPAFPENPDPNQTGVKWIPLSQLDEIVLYPNIKQHILEYAYNRSNNLSLIESHTLDSNT